MLLCAPKAAGKATSSPCGTRAAAGVFLCPRDQFFTHLSIYAIATGLGGSHISWQTETVRAVPPRVKIPTPLWDLCGRH